MSNDTRETIMHAAKLVVQQDGYNALSFRELAKAIGIKNASVHYHFPTKADLGRALAQRYNEEAEAFFEASSLTDPKDAMRSYVAIFRSALQNNNRMCLAGILLAERDGLSEDVLFEVNKFKSINVRWLADLILRQDPSGSDAEAEDKALAIFSAIEGAQLVARGAASIDLFDTCMDQYGNAGLFPAW